MLPVILLQHPLKYDMIDQAYPWRYFIGECLQNGNLPLWNPYQLLGRQSMPIRKVPPGTR